MFGRKYDVLTPVLWVVLTLILGTVLQVRYPSSVWAMTFCIILWIIGLSAAVVGFIRLSKVSKHKA